MADRWLSIDWPLLFSEMCSIATASCAHVPDFQIHTIATNPLYSNIAFRICDAQTLYNFYRHLIMWGACVVFSKMYSYSTTMCTTHVPDFLHTHHCRCRATNHAPLISCAAQCSVL